jgi:hypothetical protein
VSAEVFNFQNRRSGTRAIQITLDAANSNIWLGRNADKPDEKSCLNILWHNKGLAIGAAQKAVGFLVSQNLFGGGVEIQRAA